MANDSNLSVTLTLRIRQSRADEVESIRAIHQRAFGDPEGPGIGRLVGNLLVDETARPVLSLVAEQGATPIGSVVFSGVRISGHDPIHARILCPLAVVPDMQGTGVGSALVERGLDLLAGQGVDLVLVLGDPEYYKRFGFRQNHAIEAPHALAHPEAWMIREIKPAVLDGVRGRLRCAQCLAAAEYW